MKKYTNEFAYNLKLAAPVVLGMLGHTFVAFADNVMVGQLGTAELAAVSLGNSLVLIFMYVGIGFTTALTPLVAEADGANDIPMAKKLFKHGLLVCLIIGAVMFTLIMCSKNLLYYMEQPPEVVALAMPYLNLVAVSMVPMIIFQAFKQFADGFSQTKYPMYATIVSNVVNILLNYIFIFGAFGAPKLGIIGAAIGTLVSRVVMVLFVWYLMYHKPKFKVYFQGLTLKTIEKKIINKIMALGFPSAMQVFFEVGIFTSAVWLSGVLGKNAQAANQIALNLSSMTYMVGIGLSVAAMVRVGNQKGLQNFKELQRIASSVFFLTLLIEVVFAALFLVFRHAFPTIYLDVDDLANQQDNIAVIALAAKLLLVAAFFQISDGIQVVVLGALRGLQDVKIPTIITFIAYWLVGFPISYYLGLHTELASTGIWLGLLSGLTVSAVLLYIRFKLLTDKLIVQKSQQAKAS
ncbi:MATE family efflux transporter [Flavobacterium sp. ASW18X]|uniref:MATE family efflux transporter n=1 Tax=Flavobacterium sp. ASW18X TaxID=2572595 RepID=UPI0010AE2BF4|nr:MATE family efflux transporter [Flavobacterium sp. ASW18X]TKD62395.1 MATE family efflux transporter [Flavobacterium sp. ASW18X]